ncbi:MAG: SH3 domain-containing protein [Bacteroidales bacterium]|nr:SH3 domain-containing protein [Bacteroidales bacterium]
MIKYGISELSVIPVRKEPNDKSEMTTQILFGEVFQVTEAQGGWSNINLAFDNYEGWIESKSISKISKDVFDQINSGSNIVTQNLLNVVLNHKNEQIILPVGATLPNFKSNSKSFVINENQYQISENIFEDKLNIVSLSKQFLNSPYLWGGKNPFGIDCSGFVQVVYKVLGIKLSRDANQQIDFGETINFISEIKAGDLAFFDNEEGNIVHVGIVLNQHEIIHASGKVRIDKLDQQGIYNIENKNYSHKLRLIKRVL